MIVDDALQRYIGNSDSFDETFFDLYCSECVKFWNIEVSLFLHWWFVDDSLKKHCWHYEDFDANNNYHKGFYWPNLRNIDVSLLLCRWSLMILWRDVFETLIISWKIFLNFFVFVVLTSESLICHCWSIDESLMLLWRNSDVTAKISLQALLTFKGFIDLLSEKLMFHCCFVDDRWWCSV